jgi:hypothetical protein
MLTQDTLSMQLSQLKYGVLGKLSAARQKIQYRNFHPACGDDAVVHGIEDQIAYLARLLDRGNLEIFLKRLSELNIKLLSSPVWGRGLFVPELDELARRAGLIVTSSQNRSKDAKLLVHVASVVHPAGGHTRVIEDIAAALPEYRHVLIITDMRHLAPMDLDPLIPRFQQLRLKVHLLKPVSWTRKMRELYSLVTELGPRAVLLLAHYADSVAFVGVTGHAAPRVVFLHQCDHFPSLGAVRTDYTHVDLTPACHRICASRSHLSPSLLNLTVRDAGAAQLAEGRPLAGATCGSPHKYDGSAEFSYAQLLAELFSAGVQRILHIGDMPAEQKNQIRAEIAANGQDAQRVVFLPNTPSLAPKLIDLSPDFYVVSHPIGSGKATLEAMSVGLPILHARPSSALPLLAVDMTFGTSVTFSTLEQIPAAVDRLKSEHKALAKSSREVYEKYYSPTAFREGLLAAIESGQN